MEEKIEELKKNWETDLKTKVALVTNELRLVQS